MSTSVHNSTLDRISIPDHRGRITPDVDPDPQLGFPGAVLAGWGAVTIVVGAYERGQQVANG